MREGRWAATPSTGGAIRCRSPRSPTGRRSRCPISNSSSPGCARAGWSAACAVRAAATCSLSPPARRESPTSSSPLTSRSERRAVRRARPPGAAATRAAASPTICGRSWATRSISISARCRSPMSASKGCSAPAASSIATSVAATCPVAPPSSRTVRTEPSVAASRLTYLDHNATAPVRPAVAAAVAEALALVGNPSSVHRAGRAARRAVETARRAVAALVGAEAREVVFVSGGSEANQLALRGSGRRRILVSAIEHDSVLTAVADAEILPVDPNTGIVDLALLADRLAADKRSALVSIMLANNETGIIQPIAEIAEIVHAGGGLLHCDAIQAAGQLALDRALLCADVLWLPAHKLGGPQGVGALLVAPDVALMALQTGGGQEHGRRAGTDNVPGIVGFGRACALAAEGLAAYAP